MNARTDADEAQPAIPPRLAAFLARAIGGSVAVAASGPRVDDGEGLPEALRDDPVIDALRAIGELDVLKSDVTPRDDHGLVYVPAGVRYPHVPRYGLLMAADGASLEWLGAPTTGRPSDGAPAHGVDDGATREKPQTSDARHEQETTSDASRVAARTHTCLTLGRGPAPDAARYGLAVHGAIPDAARTVLDGIAERSQRDSDTEPLPDEAGKLLWMLAQTRRTRRALEIGTGVGASTIWVSAGLRSLGGELHSVERASHHHSAARRNLRSASLHDRVELHLGDAGRIVPRLKGTFDLVVLDVPAEQWLEQLGSIVPRLRPGALLVAHGSGQDPAADARYRAVVSTAPEFEDHAVVAAGRGLVFALRTR